MKYLLFFFVFWTTVGSGVAQPAAAPTDSLARYYHSRALDSMRAGNFYDAIPIINQAVESWAALPDADPIAYAKSAFLMSAAQYEVGNLTSSGYWVNRALSEHRRADPNAENYHNYLNRYLYQSANLAALADDCSLGRLQLDELTAHLETYPDKFIQIRIPALRANVASDCGQLEVAMALLRASITELEASQDDPYELALNYFRLSNVQYDLGELETSARNWQNSIDLFEQLSEEDPGTLSQLAGQYSERAKQLLIAKRYDEAEAMINRGLAAAKRHFTDGTGDNLAELYIYKGKLYALRGEQEQSEEYFAAAAAALVDDPTPYGENRLPRINGNTIFSQQMLLELMDVRRDLLLTSEGNDRIANLRRALSLQDNIDSLLRIKNDRLNLTESLGANNRSTLKYYEGAVMTALTLYRESGEASYLENAWRLVGALKSNYLQRFLQGPELAAVYEVPATLVVEKNQLALNLAFMEEELKGADQQQRVQLRDSMLRINNRLSLLNGQLETEYPRFVAAIRGASIPTLDEVIDALPDDQALIEYFIGEKSTYAFVVTRAGGLSYFSHPNDRNTEQLIRTMIEGASEGSQLYDRLLAPAFADLPASVSRLQIIPDGVIWDVPFAALPHESGFLVEQYAISYAYSSRQLTEAGLSARVREAEKELAGFGLSYQDMLKKLGPDSFRSLGNRDFSSLTMLPYARREVEDAEAIIGGDLWLEAAATKQQFLERGDEYRILHLAMHGLFDAANPFESALVFSGEQKGEVLSLLSMREVIGLQLPAGLAILSACHTGQGPLEEREGSRSIARAFTLAGVRTTLASNWEAYDRGTHTIMTRFYQEMSRGLPIDVALQRATLHYLETASPTYRKPIFWANLALTGPTRPLYSNPNRRYLVLLGTLLLMIAGTGILVYRLRRLKAIA